jgi:hypothetical protein
MRSLKAMREGLAKTQELGKIVNAITCTHKFSDYCIEFFVGIPFIVKII